MVKSRFVQCVCVLYIMSMFLAIPLSPCSSHSFLFITCFNGFVTSSLGISLQFSEEPSKAEEVYKRALSLATTENLHATFSNLGNLYRQQKQYERAKAMFTKSLELQPGYTPAFNNLGLVFVAEGQWEEAKFCFEKALRTDPLLDAAKSNMIKAMAMSRLCSGVP